ncbi:MAG: ArnT family glycosyltransferase [Spirulina sp.]
MKAYLSRSDCQRALLKVTTILLVLFAIGFSTVGDYGASWDEGTEISTVKYNYELITRGREIPKDLKYYGIVFNVTGELAFQVKAFATKGFSHNPLAAQSLEEGDRDVAKAIYERLRVKHPVTFLVAAIAYICVAAIVGILVGMDYAWFGPIVLALFPRFWAHGFFNPKDIPFAALFTLGTVMGALLIDFYLKRKDWELKVGFNKITLYSLLYGVLVGLVTGTRIGGFFLLFFIVLAHCLTRWNWRQILGDIPRYWLFYLLIGVAWMVTTTLVYPASWSNPAGWFFETLHYTSNHSWPGVNLFAGQEIRPTENPWYYLPVWFFLANPFIWLVTFAIGLIFIATNYRRFTNLQRACVVLVLLQVSFSPLLAIVLQANVYAGMRQFFFIIPGVAAIAAASLSWIYQKIWGQFWKLSAIALFIILISPIVFDMITLHPHQSVYFSRVSGGLSQATGRFDTDYWGLTLREGIEWVNENAEPNSTLSIGGPTYMGEMFAKPEIEVVDLESDLEYGVKGTPDYYVAMPYLQLQDLFPDCPIVHNVARQGVPITIIRDCRQARESS